MKTFKICYVSSEVLPFASTTSIGGLADASNALPIALKNLEQDVRLMMPKYKSINERKFVLREVIRLREVKVDLEGDTKLANGKTAFLPNSKVHVYFVSVPEHFDRKGFYRDPQTKNDYSDNAERFAFFCKGILETLKLLYWQPDIIHCNDWTTALIPYYLRTHYQDDEFFHNTHTLLTIHNFSDQGIFSKQDAAKIGIPKEYIAPGKEFELNGKLNLLKGGIHFANAVTTVSERYAAEIIADPKAAFGLHETLTRPGKELVGVLSGIDYAVWDPETDQNIAENYSAKTLTAKNNNKKALCKEFNLEYDASLPLIALVSELSEENGLELVLGSLKNMLKLKARWIIAGSGESKYNETLKKLAEQNQNKLAFQERHDTRLTHLLVAGSDMLLIPAKSDTKDVYLLEGLRYGTAPIVREVGVFADFINNFDPESGKGNGISFGEFKKPALVEAIQEALKMFEDRKTWAKIQKNGMRTDSSWDSTAKKYMKLYEKAVKKK